MPPAPSMRRSITFSSIAFFPTTFSPTSRPSLASLTFSCPNLALRGYFKYADFLVSVWRGATLGSANVPLALSFTTFVQIAFLCDVYRDRRPIEGRRYGMFVTFFPHLIAGPIVRWNELGHQI